jgi:peptidyl-prolyl cis-trans isomerase D
MIRFLQSSGKTMKLILGAILVVICGAMVVTLVPGGILGDAFGFGGVQQGVLARVGGADVTLTDVDRTARNIARQQFGGRSIPEGLLPFLRQSAANQLITQKALLVEAERMGLKVTDTEVQDTLQHGPLSQYFFPGGNFIGQPQYEGFVSQNFNMSIPQFEQAVKDDLLLTKLQAAVEGPVSVAKQDVEQEFKRQNTKVKFQYAVLTLDEVTKSIKPTEGDLKTFYDQHKASYTNAIPEKRQVKYAVLDSAKVANQVQVTPADLQTYYRDHQDQYRVPEQVNVRHILIKTPLPGPDGKVDQNAANAARAKAEDVLKKLQAGGNFAELAKKFSDDTGSAEKGGDLGWINRGQTVPEFEKTAFSLKKGDTSGLVQSSYGFHIIQLMDKHDAHLKSLAEVKDEIEPIVRQQKAQAAADNLANKFASQARSEGLDKAAQANGLDVLTSNLITRTDTLPGIGTAPQLMDAIFSAPVKGSPESTSTPQGYVVFQVVDSKPPATPTFEEIRARVESDYKADRAQALLAQRTKELADKAKSEHDLKKAAQQVGASVKTSDLVTISSQVPDLGRMADAASVAFTLKPGEISGPISTGRSGAVISLLEKQEPSADEMAKGSEQVREALLQQKRGEAFQLFAVGLRQRLEKDGKIRINKAEMDRLTSTKASDTGD